VCVCVCVCFFHCCIILLADFRLCDDQKDIIRRLEARVAVLEQKGVNSCFGCRETRPARLRFEISEGRRGPNGLLCWSKQVFWCSAAMTTKAQRQRSIFQLNVKSGSLRAALPPKRRFPVNRCRSSGSKNWFLNRTSVDAHGCGFLFCCGACIVPGHGLFYVSFSGCCRILLCLCD
jgi:hypothetical protein